MNIEQILKKLNKMRCLKYETHTHYVFNDDIQLIFYKSYDQSEWDFKCLILDCWNIELKQRQLIEITDQIKSQYIINELSKKGINNLTKNLIDEIENNYVYPTLKEIEK